MPLGVTRLSSTLVFGYILQHSQFFGVLWISESVKYRLQAGQVKLHFQQVRDFSVQYHAETGD